MSCFGLFVFFMSPSCWLNSAQTLRTNHHQPCHGKSKDKVKAASLPRPTAPVVKILSSIRRLDRDRRLGPHLLDKGTRPCVKLEGSNKATHMKLRMLHSGHTLLPYHHPVACRKLSPHPLHVKRGKVRSRWVHLATNEFRKKKSSVKCCLNNVYRIVGTRVMMLTPANMEDRAACSFFLRATRTFSWAIVRP